MEASFRAQRRVRAWSLGPPSGDPREDTVAAVMSAPVETIDVNVSLEQALARMRDRHLHHLLLTDRDVVVALISDRNLLRAMGLGPAQREAEARYRRHPVFQVAEYHLVTVREETSIEDAAAILLERDFSALPIVNEADEIVGIVTIRDLLRHLAGIEANPLVDIGPAPAEGELRRAS